MEQIHSRPVQLRLLCCSGHCVAGRIGNACACRCTVSRGRGGRRRPTHEAPNAAGCGAPPLAPRPARHPQRCGCGQQSCLCTTSGVLVYTDQVSMTASVTHVQCSNACRLLGHGFHGLTGQPGAAERIGILKRIVVCERAASCCNCILFSSLKHFAAKSQQHCNAALSLISAGKQMSIAQTRLNGSMLTLLSYPKVFLNASANCSATSAMRSLCPSSCSKDVALRLLMPHATMCW